MPPDGFHWVAGAAVIDRMRTAGPTQADHGPRACVHGHIATAAGERPGQAEG